MAIDRQPRNAERMAEDDVRGFAAHARQLDEGVHAGGHLAAVRVHECPRHADERVNQVTPALFKRYPDARALSKATTGELEPQIQSTGFFRAKSKSLLGMATAVVDKHAGAVPATMEALTDLPGVGRKTANVVLGHALGVPGLPVDRHVLRVSNRIGIAKSDDPEIVEQQLCAAMPKDKWTLTSDTLILHGRRICKPKPLCEKCAVRDQCLYFLKVVSRQKVEDRR